MKNKCSSFQDMTSPDTYFYSLLSGQRLDFTSKEEISHYSFQKHFTQVTRKRAFTAFPLNIHLALILFMSFPSS